MFAMKTNALMFARHRPLVAIMLSVFHKSIRIPVSAEKAISEIQSLAVGNDFTAILMTTVRPLNSVMLTTTVAVPAVLIAIAIRTSGAKMESVFRSVRLTPTAPMTTNALDGNASQKLKANVSQTWNVAITWAVAQTKEG